LYAELSLHVHLLKAINQVDNISHISTQLNVGKQCIARVSQETLESRDRGNLFRRRTYCLLLRIVIIIIRSDLKYILQLRATLYTRGPIEEGVFAMYTVKEGWLCARYNTHVNVTHPACMCTTQNHPLDCTIASFRFISPCM
jgi:hypothetical protein